MNIQQFNRVLLFMHIEEINLLALLNFLSAANAHMHAETINSILVHT